MKILVAALLALLFIASSVVECSNETTTFLSSDIDNNTTKIRQDDFNVSILIIISSIFILLKSPQ